MNQLTALKKAVELAGGQTALARAVDAKQVNVWSWLNRSKKTPPEYVIPVEKATGISRHKLRPDIYPEETA
jgi:DNA-binding transcriptional regulator YdaS (Cro superfamily)